MEFDSFSNEKVFSINQEGKEIVTPIYKEIGNFGKYKKDVALVTSFMKWYGFIDVNGKEIVTAEYRNLDDAIKELNK